jgi:preprotein translocase subunit SecE
MRRVPARRGTAPSAERFRAGCKGGEQMKKILQFFQESYAELRKVVWPSNEQVVSSTKVVLLSTVIFAVVLGIVDFIFLKGLDFIF